MLKKPEFQVDISLKGDSLVLYYSVKNVSKKNIYLFNVPMGLYSQYEKVFVSLIKDTLSLSKRIPPYPKHILRDYAEIPFARKLKPGGTFQETIRLKLPIEENNPYYPFDDGRSKYELRTAKRIKFSIDYIPELVGLQAKPTEVKGAYFIDYPYLYDSVKTLTSKAFAISVKVKYRTDLFERF